MTNVPIATLVLAVNIWNNAIDGMKLIARVRFERFKVGEMRIDMRVLAAS